MARQSRQQKETIGRVMHEFKHGELERGRGGKVKSRRQAIAIAMHEAGASKSESKAANRANLRKTKAKERRGETAQAQKESGRTSARKRTSGRGRHATRAELYAKAKRRNIPGRSHMNKAELELALRR